MSAFWDNNKDTFKAAGKATVKGIGHGTKVVSKAGYGAYKNHKAGGSSLTKDGDVESESVRESRPLPMKDVSSFPAPPKRNVGAYPVPERGSPSAYSRSNSTQSVGTSSSQSTAPPPSQPYGQAQQPQVNQPAPQYNHQVSHNNLPAYSQSPYETNNPIYGQQAQLQQPTSQARPLPPPPPARNIPIPTQSNAIQVAGQAFEQPIVNQSYSNQPQPVVNQNYPNQHYQQQQHLQAQPSLQQNYQFTQQQPQQQQQQLPSVQNQSTIQQVNTAAVPLQTQSTVPQSLSYDNPYHPYISSESELSTPAVTPPQSAYGRDAFASPQAVTSYDSTQLTTPAQEVHQPLPMISHISQATFPAKQAADFRSLPPPPIHKARGTPSSSVPILPTRSNTSSPGLSIPSVESSQISMTKYPPPPGRSYNAQKEFQPVGRPNSHLTESDTSSKIEEDDLSSSQSKPYEPFGVSSIISKYVAKEDSPPTPKPTPRPTGITAAASMLKSNIPQVISGISAINQAAASAPKKAPPPKPARKPSGLIDTDARKREDISQHIAQLDLDFEHRSNIISTDKMGLKKIQPIPVPLKSFGTQSDAIAQEQKLKPVPKPKPHPNNISTKIPFTEENDVVNLRNGLRKTNYLTEVKPTEFESEGLITKLKSNTPPTIPSSKKSAPTLVHVDFPSNGSSEPKTKPKPPKPKSKPKPITITTVAGPSPTSTAVIPPPPPPTRAKIQVPVVSSMPDFSLEPKLDYELSSGWYKSQNMLLPKDLQGRTFKMVGGSSGQENFRIFSFRLSNISQIKLRISWNDGIANSTKLETRYIPPPKLPSKEQLINNNEIFGNYVANWCEVKEGTQVGDGECWTLAHDALEKGCGKHAFVSSGLVHGALLFHIRAEEIEVDGTRREGPVFVIPPADELRRGDILQFKSVVLKSGGSVQKLGMPDHTAIVLGKVDDKLKIIHQNVSGDKTVQRGEISLRYLSGGEVKAYRAMNSEWVDELDTNW